MSELVNELNFSNKCIEDGILDNLFKIIERIGDESQYGEVYSGCDVLSCKYKLAIKKIPLEDYEKKILLRKRIPLNIKIINSSPSLSEYYILELITKLVKNHICPNFPVTYNYYICNKCKYTNPNIIKFNPNYDACMLIITELANGSLSHMFRNNKNILKSKTIKIIYLQIYLGLYCLRKYYNIYHNDLHIGNVLYKKIPKKKKYIRYIINNEKYNIPNIGYIMLIWDFGLATIPDVINYNKTVHDWEDYVRITSMLLHMNKKDEGIDKNQQKMLKNISKQIFNLMESSENSQDFTLKYAKKLSVENIDENEVLDTYNMDKTI